MKYFKSAQIWPVCDKGITQFYLPPTHRCRYSPAARHHCLLSGTHCAYAWGDGQAELNWVAGYIPLRMRRRPNSNYRFKIRRMF